MVDVANRRCEADGCHKVRCLRHTLRSLVWHASPCNQAACVQACNGEDACQSRSPTGVFLRLSQECFCQSPRLQDMCKSSETGKR